MYIGFVVNKLIGIGITLNINEVEIFCKEESQIPDITNPIYISSNILQNSYLPNYYNKNQKKNFEDMNNGKDQLYPNKNPIKVKNK
jgi:hypothetical protein